MSDIFSVKKRSEIMRKVRNKNTNIELILRKALFKDGVRFRVKNKLFGKPDIIISEEKIAIFCDGDFWHGRNFRKEADGYKDFWKEKIRTNIERDILVNKTLEKEGWRVLRFWKTEILKDLDKCVDKVKDKINLQD